MEKLASGGVITPPLACGPLALVTTKPNDSSVYLSKATSYPREQISWGQHGAHLTASDAPHVGSTNLAIKEVIQDDVNKTKHQQDIGKT